MKLIKMNSRWIQCRDHGHTAVIKFPSWNTQAKEVEKAMRELTGGSGWWRANPWYGWTGKAQGNLPRPHFISAKDEQLLTMAILKAGFHE